MHPSSATGRDALLPLHVRRQSATCRSGGRIHLDVAIVIVIVSILSFVIDDLRGAPVKERINSALEEWRTWPDSHRFSTPYITDGGEHPS